MTRITKIELEQLLAQRNNELEAARLEISRLRGQIEMAPRAAARARPAMSLRRTSTAMGCA